MNHSYLTFHGITMVSLQKFGNWPSLHGNGGHFDNMMNIHGSIVQTSDEASYSTWSWSYPCIFQKELKSDSALSLLVNLRGGGPDRSAPAEYSQTRRYGGALFHQFHPQPLPLQPPTTHPQHPQHPQHPLPLQPPITPTHPQHPLPLQHPLQLPPQHPQHPLQPPTTHPQHPQHPLPLQHPLQHPQHPLQPPTTHPQHPQHPLPLQQLLQQQQLNRLLEQRQQLQQQLNRILELLSHPHVSPHAPHPPHGSSSEPTICNSPVSPHAPHSHVSPNSSQRTMCNSPCNFPPKSSG